MRVLSLFDGMGCGMIALRELGIEPEVYYASEVDKHAIKQTQLNFPDVIHLGDVTKWKEWDIDWKSIDLVLAGSPCQGFSFFGKQLAFDDPRSKLFFIFIDILNHIRSLNPDVLFLLENVDMKKSYMKIISECCGVFPVNINSNLVSAQNRDRWYWTNIQTKRLGLLNEVHADIPQPEDKGILLRDILEKEVDEKYYIISKRLEYIMKEFRLQKRYTQINSENKALTLTARGYSSWTGNYIRGNTGRIRQLTIAECSRLQTIPTWYKWECLDSQAYKMLGNGWTVEVIKHIFSFIKLKKKNMVELDSEFEGVGEVKGYRFKQLFMTDYAYMYEKTHIDSGTKSYEVFKRKENIQFNCISYPRSKSFGVWAYDCSTFERAKELFDKFNEKKMDKVL